MSRFRPEPEHRHGMPQHAGILLVNLGTPEAPTKQALRPYLRQFLSDPRVIEIPRALWWPLLHLVVLNTRPAKSAEKYAKIWMAEGSPLKVHTERQAKMLRGYLGTRVRIPIQVEYAMRYGQPGIAEGIEKLKQMNCDRILLLPLYPQYAASTTGSAFDAVFAALQKMRDAPALRAVKHYHDHPGYIAALRASVLDYWMKTGRPDLLVISFHGVPRRSLDRGDPYHCECQKTARLLAQSLQLGPHQHVVSFQSRFGRAQWLQPYTSELLQELGKKKLKRVDIVCPGFVADCLETLEEIAMEAKATFLNAGGGAFHYIPALNERDDWLHALADIALENLQGWLRESDPQALAESAERARALGAKS